MISSFRRWMSGRNFLDICDVEAVEVSSAAVSLGRWRVKVFMGFFNFV